MTEKEIDEGNKLICEFMGHSTDEDFIELFGYDIYDQRWDKLMPVVEKIEEVNGCPYRVVITSNLTYITDKSKHGTPEIVRKANKERKENTWLAVVEFIKYFNQNK